MAPSASCTRTSRGGAGALAISHSAPARFLRLVQSEAGPLTCTAATDPWKPTCCTTAQLVRILQQDCSSPGLLVLLDGWWLPRA